MPAAIDSSEYTEKYDSELDQGSNPVDERASSEPGILPKKHFSVAPDLGVDDLCGSAARGDRRQILLNVGQHVTQRVDFVAA